MSRVPLLSLGASLAVAAALGGCGGPRQVPAPRGGLTAAAPAQIAMLPPAHPALGLDESNASLLVETNPPPAGLTPWRTALVALQPRYLRFVINWARLQPHPGSPPGWDAPADGCLRELPPCAPYAGVRAELRATAALQRAGDPVQAVVTFAEVPTWAARPPDGCERAQATPFARPLNALGWAAYQRLIVSLLVEARRDGVEVPFLSPWNEPNNPRFLSPQRASCAAAAPSQAPAVYARMARIASAALTAAGSPGRLLLGELAGYGTRGPRHTSIAEFIAGLPPEVVCLAGTWTVHDYVSPDSAGAAQLGPVSRLEDALNLRGGCATGAPVWVTETGAGGSRPGQARRGALEARADCRAMAGALERWTADPRVAAVIQYTFRDDTAFPVGLADASLSRLYPTYWLWRAWARRSAGSDQPAPLPPQCA